MTELSQNTPPQSSVEYFLSERRQRVAADLAALTGKFGLHGSADGTGVLISNDCGYALVGSAFYEHLQQSQDGIGVSIGSGGVLSWLPSVRADCVAVLDTDPSVLAVNQRIAELVVAAHSPDDAKARIARDAAITDQTLHSSQAITALLNAEAATYGPYHWSNPRRFPRVQEALRATPIAYVEADIANPQLGHALTETLAQHNLDISFANFTNVHWWVEGSMERYLQNWPFREAAPILFSTAGADGGYYPSMRIAQDLSEYLYLTSEDKALSS